MKIFDYLGILHVIVTIFVIFAHLLLLDSICTDLIMETAPEAESVFSTAAIPDTPYQGLYVMDKLLKGHIEFFYLNGKPLESLSKQEALELKYKLLRKLDAMEDKTTSVGKANYLDLLKQIYAIEYCFFDNHFIRNEKNILVLNEDYTVKTIEHPEDIKKLFIKFYPDFILLDKINRRWMEKSHNLIFRNGEDSIYDPAELLRLKPTCTKHTRYINGFGGQFFKGLALINFSAEDRELAREYITSPLDFLRLQPEEDSNDFVLQQHRINKGFFQFCVLTIENMRQKREDEPVLIDFLEKSGICSDANILIYKKYFLEAAEMKAAEIEDYDFHSSSIEGQALVQLRFPENQIPKEYYPFHAKREQHGTGHVFMPPIFFNYNEFLPSSFLLDVKLNEVNNRMCSLYNAHGEKTHTNLQNSPATGIFKNYALLYSLGYFEQSSFLTKLIENILIYQWPIIKNNLYRGDHQTELFFLLYVLEEKPFNDIKNFFDLTDLDMAEIRHTPKKLNCFLSFYKQFEEKIVAISADERRQYGYDWRTAQKEKNLF